MLLKTLFAFRFAGDEPFPVPFALQVIPEYPAEGQEGLRLPGGENKPG
jgi:hypothetical protein